MEKLILNCEASMKKVFSVLVLLSIFSVSSVFGLDYTRETIYVSEGFAGAYNVSAEHQSTVLAGSAEVADDINNLVAIAKTKKDKYAIFLCDTQAHKIVYKEGSVRPTLYKFTQIFDMKNCRLRD